MGRMRGQHGLRLSERIIKKKLLLTKCSQTVRIHDLFLNHKQKKSCSLIYIYREKGAAARTNVINFNA